MEKTYQVEYFLWVNPCQFAISWQGISLNKTTEFRLLSIKPVPVYAGK